MQKVIIGFVIVALLCFVGTWAYITGDVALTMLQSQTAEAHARTAEAQAHEAEANAKAEDARTEQAWATVAQIQAETESRAIDNLIEALREELRRQGRRATMSTVLSKVQSLFFWANLAVWGLVGLMIAKDRTG